MINPARKLYKYHQPTSNPNKRVRRKVKKKRLISSQTGAGDKDLIAPQRGRGLGSMVSIALLLCSGSLIAMFGWFSMLFICNPDQLSWLNRILPQWAKISFSNGEIAQTIPQIEAYLTDQGKIAGQIIPLDGESKKSFLLPVFQERENCQLNCKYIVELRVYQQSIHSKLKSESEQSYNLATQVPITGPEESFVLAPLAEAADDNQDPLPLTKVGRFEGATPSPGVWFYLQGQRQQGTNASGASPQRFAIAYGHIFHYNPHRTHLRLMLSWTSPKGQLPEWQSITGKVKQLVIDQTLGLEPRLHVYQVKPADPVQLEEISLTPPAVQDSAYENALLIARSGLWTPAFNWLEFMKKQREQPFSAKAQAQIDIIHLHSQLTKIQADKTWASPSQQVLANLIDGRWEKALQVFKASPQNAQEITTLLKADTGRLWGRVEAALKVKPNRPEVQAWGSLILAAKFGEERANTWVKNQEGVGSREQGVGSREQGVGSRE